MTSRWPNGREARLRAYTTDPAELSFYNEGFEQGKQVTEEVGGPPPGRQFYIMVDCHGTRIPAPPLPLPDPSKPDGTSYHPGGIFYMPVQGAYDDPNAWVSWKSPGGLAPHQQIMFLSPDGESAWATRNQTAVECKTIISRYQEIVKNPHYEPDFPPEKYRETISNRIIDGKISGGADYEYALGGDTNGKFRAAVSECLDQVPPILDLQDSRYQGIPFSWVYYYICAYVCGRMGGDLRGVSIYVHAMFCRGGECPVGPLRAQRSGPPIEPPRLVSQMSQEIAAAKLAEWEKKHYFDNPHEPKHSMDMDLGGRRKRMTRRKKVKKAKKLKKKTRRVRQRRK